MANVVDSKQRGAVTPPVSRGGQASDRRLVAGMQTGSRILSAGVVMLGLAVLVSWAFDAPAQLNITSSFLPMKANTALLFVLLGIGLWLSANDGAPRVRRALASFVASVALLTLSEYAFDLQWGIDELLFRDASKGQYPGRMAPTTALNFSLFGFAILSIGTRVRLAGDVAVLSAGAVSFVALCGYVYGAVGLYRIGPYVSIAFSTSIGFLAAALAFFAARPAQTLLAGAVSDTVAGALMRRTLPAVALLSPLLGWIVLRGQRAGLYDASFGVAGLVAANTGLVGAAVAVISNSLHRSELERRQAEQAAAKRGERLRQLVEESPAALAVFDLDMRYVFASARWLSEFKLALTTEQIRGRSHYELFPEIPERWKLIHERCLAGESLQSDGEPFTRANGSVLWIRWQVQPWLDDDGLVGGLLMFSEDISERKQAEVELERATEQFRQALEAAPTGMLLVDEAGKIVLVNAATEALFGFTRDELLGRPLDALVPERYRDRHAGHRAAFFSQPRARRMGPGRELHGLRKDGSEVPIEIALNPLETSAGQFVLSSVLDISERKQAERERAELLVQREVAKLHEERSRFFELSIDMVCIANTAGYFVQLNPSFSRTLGYSRDELLARPFLDFVHPDDQPASRAELEKLSRGGLTLDFVNRFLCKDGSFRWLQWRCIPEAEGTLYAIARDVSRDRELVESLRSQQASLSASLKEREVLLQEIHHRVKNNLQVVVSLINMQSRQVSDPSTRIALEECQNRIQTIALVHQQLYQSRDYSRVPFSDYAKHLAANVFQATGLSGGSVSLEFDVEALSLTVDRAIPCGLILNELLTNAARHAFPAGRSGVVRVTLRKTGDDGVVLAVSDDGVGLPPSFDPDKLHSLGLEIVATLVAQLDGTLQISRDVRTTFSVGFQMGEAR